MPPKPRGHNASVYIIICSRRISVSAATSTIEKLKEASFAAADVVGQLELLYPKTLTQGMVTPVTELQHYIMDNLHSMDGAEADAKVEEMFQLLDALEEHFGGEHEY